MAYFSFKLQSAVVVILLSLSVSLSIAQAPQWTNYALRQAAYPESTYLIGFSSERNIQDTDENQLKEKLVGYAKDQLVENIMVDIRSVTTLNIHNINTETMEELQRSSSSFSQAKIAGLKTDSYYDKKKKEAFAIAYARKSDVVQLYANTIISKLEEIESQISLGDQAYKKGDRQSALQYYFSSQAPLREIEEAQTLIVTITGDADNDRLKRDEVRTTKLSLNEKVNQIKSTDNFSIDDASIFIASGLKTQLQEKDAAPILIKGYTFQDTPMSSPFSRKLINSLEQKLISVGQFDVLGPQSTAQDSYILSGTYWQEGEKIKITSILRNQQTGSAVASLECHVPIQSLSQKGIIFQPENYKDALRTMQLFAKDELKGGDLQVDILTNKGKNNLIFTEGETLKLLVRANRECYLRFIYHLADGSKVLLLDNYYVNRDKVNQFYELPYEFECAEPFGVETLQLNAQTTAFAPLSVQSEYGYDFIVDKPDEIITKTRGFKRKLSAETDLKAEKRVVFTTMNR